MGEIPESYEVVRRYRDDYLREWDQRVTPLEERASKADEESIGFAHGALKCGFILSGGALIAVPAIVGLFSFQTDSIVIPLATSIALFIASLIASWLAYGVAYFAMCYRAAQRYQAREIEALKVNELSPGAKAADLAEVHKFESGRDRYGRWFNRLRYAAIALCVVSFLAFLAGAYTGGQTILASLYSPS